MNKTIRVAITAERINNRAYELTFRAFNDLTMFELCTPILYGVRRDIEALYKALDIQVNMVFINKVEEVQDGKLNILDTNPDLSFSRATDDCQQQRVDVMVVLGTPHQLEGNKVVLVNGSLRILLAEENWTKENFEEQASMFKNILRRDFMLSNPRIAVIDESLRPIIDNLKNLAEEDFKSPNNQFITVFGPYNLESFVTERIYEQFDGIMTSSKEQAKQLFDATYDVHGTTLITGLPFVVTSSFMSGKSMRQQDIEDNSAGQPLRNAVYLAIDVHRHRINYDRPYQNPLPKLYHEKKDESEKVRFAIPKAKSDKNNTKLAAVDQNVNEETVE